MRKPFTALQRLGISIFLVGMVMGFIPGLQAQKSITDSTIGLTLAQITYRGMIPGGDMADRFGFVSEFGIDLVYKFKNNFYISSGFQECLRIALKNPIVGKFKNSQDL
ncbi:MAG: hypothetical protein R3B93_00265 [Bacteroidia bacterium]